MNTNNDYKLKVIADKAAYRNKLRKTARYKVQKVFPPISMNGLQKIAAPFDLGPTIGLLHPTAKQTQDSSLRFGNTVNNYKNLDLSKPQVLLVEVPITNGVLPFARHSQTVALLPKERWANLPASERTKYRAAPWHSREGDVPVYWRTFSTSPSENDQYFMPNSQEGDWFVAHTLIGGNDAEIRPWSLRPSVWQHGSPVKITSNPYYKSPLNPQGSTASSTSQSTWDGLGSMAPRNVAPIALYDDRLDDNGNKMPIEVTINDAMNAGERIATIMANGRPYTVGTNNCHFGTIAANALNPYFAPGRFGTGGVRGFSMDSEDDPFNKYFWSYNPLGRMYVPFRVEQRSPTEQNYTRKREAALDALENKMTKWRELREEKTRDQLPVFPIP